MMSSAEQRISEDLRTYSAIPIEQQMHARSTPGRRAQQEQPALWRPVSKNIATVIIPAFALVALAALASCADANSATTVAALSTPTADECSFVTHAALADVGLPIDEAIVLSDVDKEQHGVTGAYFLAAVAANDYLRAARAKVVEMDDYMTENGPVIYSMGPDYSFRSADVWNQLDSASWWLQVSASYHMSIEARQAIELAGGAMEVAAALRMHAVRCYVDAYQPLP
jgi:hypothetical protein